MIIKKLNGLFHKHSRWLFGGFTVVIIVSFLGFLTPGQFGCDFSDPESHEFGVAFGKPVTYRDLREMGRNVQIINHVMSGVSNREIDVQNLFGPYCLLQAAERMGIVASDKEVAEMLRQMPTLQKDGKFSMELYNEMLAGYQKAGISAEEFNNAIRMMVMLNKLDREIAAGVVVTPGEVESFYRRLYGKYRIKGALFNADTFKDKVPRDARKMQEFFEKNRSEYVIQAKLSALVVAFPYAGFRAEAANAATAAELEKFYKANTALFDDKDGKTQEYAKVAGEVKKKFIEARSRDLATRRAYDFASAAYEAVGEAENKVEVFRELARKGKLDIIETGRFDIDATVVGKINSPVLIRQLGAALNAGNPVTNAVPGDDAAYVGFTLGQIAARPAMLNEVAKQLNDDYVAAESLKLAREAAKADLDRIKALKPAERAKAFAALKNCKVEEFEASVSQMPPAGFEYAMQAAVRLHPGELTPVVDTPNGAAIAELLERIPADMKEFEAKKALYTGIFRQRKEQMARLAFEEELGSQCYLLEQQQPQQ